MKKMLASMFAVLMLLVAVPQMCFADDVTVFDKGIIINHNKNRANLH